jgi:pyruvate kinase
MQKTKRICKIGPASEDPEILREMMLCGMNSARLNFSHGTHPEHLEKVNNIKRLRAELELPVSILLDTKGPEIRVKNFAEGQVELKSGEPFTLTTRDVEGTEEIVSVSYKGLPANVKPGARILLDDGLIELTVESIKDTDIYCRVAFGGILSNHKSINLPGVSVDMPYISETDKADLTFAYENDVDYIALSFVRSAEDVLQVKNFLAALGSARCELISKIENAEGVTNIDEIIRVSDGIMVARGDMGVEIPFEELPAIQKSLISKCYMNGKKVITATQMLESMIRNPRPTRAEITDIANAIYDGTSAIMLSGETASGKYPIESLKTMAKIAIKTEASIDYRSRFDLINPVAGNTITDAISHATCTSARDLGAAAIAAVTIGGSTPRMISRFRPEAPIIAVTPNIKTFMLLSLSWGVTPLLSEYIDSPGGIVKSAADKILAIGLAKEGDLIVVTGSSQPKSSVTNMLQVHMLGNVLIRGEGRGNNAVSGKACVVSTRLPFSDYFDNCVMVIDKTTTESLQIVRRAKAVITEEEFSVSGIAAAAVALDIPLITSAADATKLISNGDAVTADPIRGVVYNCEYLIS